MYATERSYLLFPFVNLGLVPEFASSLLLARLVGAQRAAEILLLGEKMPVAQAARLGLVNEVLPDAKTLNDRVAEQAGKLLSKPASAVRATRSLLRETASQTAQERLAAESTLFAELLRSPEAAARIAAVMGR